MSASDSPRHHRGRDEYVFACHLNDIPTDSGLGVEVQGHRLVLFRLGREVFALEDNCPHAGMPLRGGRLHGEVVTCPWHGWPFHVRTGTLPGAEEFTVPTYDVKLQGDEVLVQLVPKSKG